MMQIQTILLIPEYINQYWFNDDDNDEPARQITHENYWELYDKSWLDQKIKVLEPITKE